jgi:hypothetical protein
LSSDFSPATATIPYLSSFNPRTDHVDPPAQTKVNLIVIEASSDVNGKVELDESTQHPLPDPTYIHDKSFARGTMKVVHKASFMFWTSSSNLTSFSLSRRLGKTCRR